MTFIKRAGQHDDRAVPIVANLFQSHGFQCHVLGTESDSAALHTALMAQSDRTSIMLRFRPDRVFVKRGLRSLLCEVKSDDSGRPNFAIEIDSYRAACEWQVVMFAMVDLALAEPRIFCCWVNEVPRPKVILVPRRFDFNTTYERLQKEWPGINLKPLDHRGGSGTAFFLVPKNSTFLRPFDRFMVELDRPQVSILKQAALPLEAINHAA